MKDEITTVDSLNERRERNSSEPVAVNDHFRVGVTRDFLKPDGTPGFGDIGLDLLSADPRIAWEYLAEYDDELPATAARNYDALLVLAPRVTERTLAGGDRLTIVARFGVGYDRIDVPACTRHDVVLTIAPDGVRRPVAASAVTFLLALAHKLFDKDKLTRAGRWHDKLDYMGMGVTGRTLGLIGLGNIGREICRLLRPFEMRFTAFDPYCPPDAAADVGATLVPLDELTATSDFVCITCALTPETHHLLDARRLASLKPTAYLINVARGPIVDQAALTTVLQERRIASAALDVFEQEPLDPRDPLLALDNVIVAPHALCWTDEMALGIGRSACRGILEAAAGRTPQHVVNREVWERPGLQAKLRRRK